MLFPKREATDENARSPYPLICVIGKWKVRPIHVRSINAFPDPSRWLIDFLQPPSQKMTEGSFQNRMPPAIYDRVNTAVCTKHNVCREIIDVRHIRNEDAN